MGGIGIVFFLVVLGVFIGVFGGRFREAFARARARRELEVALWGDVARALGGTTEPRRWLRATVDGVDVEVRVVEHTSTSTNADGSTSTSTSYSTRYTFRGRFADGLDLGRESALTRAFGRDLELGDAAFDRAVKVGSGVELLLGLSAAERGALAERVADGWWVGKGALTFSHDGIDAAELQPTIVQGLKLARGLATLADHHGERLAQRVDDDPQVLVRMRALEVLGAGGDHLAADFARALPRALADEAPVVCLAAALRVDHEPTLRALATGPDGDLAALVRKDDEATSLMAIEALARVGSVADVALLVPLRERVFGGERKKAAREAIARIQARLDGGERGALALSEGGAGDLALATEPDR